MKSINNIFDYFEEEISTNESFAKECEIEQAKLELAEMLREYRKSLKISQEELACRSGLTRQMISKVETYTSTPTLTTLMKYLDAINIDLNGLIKKELQSKM